MLSDTCAPLSGAQAKSQPRENCWAAQTVKGGLELDQSFCMVPPQSPDAFSASRVQQDIMKLPKVFDGVLPSEQLVSICKAYHVGGSTSSPTKTPRTLKVIFRTTVQRKLLMNRIGNIAE